MNFNRVDEVARWRLCMGCGACEWACPNGAVHLTSDVNKGIRPVVDESRCEACEICMRVCPGWKLEQTSFPAHVIPELEKAWGPVLNISEGFSTDREIRFKGSSGGASTAIALWAIEKQVYSGVLHTKPDDRNPIANRPVFSQTRTGLLEAVGSRYAPAAVCSAFEAIKVAQGPAIFIGKPCDCAALWKAASENKTLKNNIGLVVSIFCAGTPATSGTLAILQEMGIDGHDKITSFRYRGYGWPGEATAELKFLNHEKVEGGGRKRCMSYERAWGDILTRHVQHRCRLCPDKTGEFADISVGDPWYRKERDEGRSLILTRSERGETILKEVVASGFLEIESIDWQRLMESQVSIYENRCQLWGRLKAMTWLKTPSPVYEGFFLRDNWRTLSLGRRCWTILGTLRRIIRRNWNKPEKPIDTALSSSTTK